MSFGSFLQGVVAQVNPFDNGKTYGSYNPPKKKLQPGDPGYVAPAPAPQQQQQAPAIKTQNPTNLFQGLNSNITSLKAPVANTVTPAVNSNINLKPLTTPVPGQVITPQQNNQPAQPALAPKPTPAPIQHTSLLGHIGNALKTTAEVGGSLVSAVPAVVLGAGRVATGIVQGATQLPHIVSSAEATGTKALADNFSNPVTRTLNRVSQDVNTGVKKATNVVNVPLNGIGHGLDVAAQKYNQIAPEPENIGINDQVYHDTQVPLNVLAGLLTLGTAPAAEAGGAASDAAEAGQAGKAGGIISKITDFLNAPRSTNPDNIIAKTAQAVQGPGAPVVRALNAPISAARTGVSSLINRVAVPAVDRAAVDAGEAGNVLNDAQLNDLTAPPTQIQVQQPTQIPVTAPETEPMNIPVTNNTPVGQPIVEVGGDKPGVVQMPTPDQVAAQRAANNFTNQPAGRPDPNIEGVTPAPVAAPYKIDATASAASQDDLVNQYAGFLKDVGQGNGTQLVPDGEGGYIRTSNNMRFGDTGGKNMTNADWQAEAERQLKAGQADPSIQKQFDDANNPEVQSLLAKGDQTADQPVGSPIQVKEVKGIPVQDQSTVPEGLPNTPGTVKPTTAAAPTQAETATVAKTPTVAAPTQLPKETQNVLDNPKSFNKRQVAAARNQLKLAKQLNKTKAATAALSDSGTTIHLPSKGIYAKLSPDQAGALADEVNNVKSDAGDIVHLSANTPALRNGAKEVSLDEIKSQSDNAKATLDNVKPPGSQGFVQTGDFGKSANGGAYEKVGRAAEMKQALHETANMSPAEVLKTARANQVGSGTFNRADVRNVMAMFENKRIARGTPEFNEAKAILKEDGTHQAQALALRGGNVIRRTATSDQLTSQFESKIYRMVDDPTKVDSTAFDKVDAAESKFTAARDSATQAYNRFTEVPTSANAKAYHAAQDAADAAEKGAKTTEYEVAQQTLKGNKDPKQIKELQKMAQSADMYQMDGVDASMLSGTGTFSRNLVNAAIGGGEEGLFGKVGAKIANKITGEDVGGGVGRGTISGFGKGVHNIVDASKARAAAAGKNPLEHLKNFATTGNQLGDAVIDSQVEHNVIDHYTQQLKDEGYKGSELTNRAGVMARQDPDDISKVYAGAARASAGLGSGISKGSKPESVIRDAISKFISGGNPGEKSDIAAKLITRMTVGFPSAIGRSLSEGAKRASLGSLNALKLFGKAARNDPAVRAQIIKESIKQAGSGATTGMIFYGLGASGLVTGAYPTDPEQRAEWTREGKTENSIKIDGNWYQMPSYLGVAALPAIFAASLGRNNGNVEKATAEVAKAIPSILPTDQASNVLNVINGDSSAGKFVQQTAASAVRAATPAGALLNQIAKSFDPTTNDTSDGSALSNFADKVLSGIPGENLFAHIPDKTDDQGNVIHNPSAGALAVGASTAVQDKGVQATNDINDQTNTQLKSISDAGALDDPNIKKVLDTANLQLYNQAKSGKQLSPDDLKKLQTAMTRGVSSDGSDTAYLEKEQYDSNLAALKVKRDVMAADPTTKPTDLQKMDTAITRGQLYQKYAVPYDQIQAYEKTSLSAWRDMGDPKSADYDPDQYQALYNIDQAMTKAGVSYKTSDPTQSKYSAKSSSSGSGSASNGFSADFGTIKASDFSPKLQAYQSIDTKSGSVPIIQQTQPNIVHKISSSG